VDRPSEDEFRAVVARSTRPHLSVVELHTLPLDHYPGYMVGVALWAGRTRS
jgi:hypothetical protein